MSPVSRGMVNRLLEVDGILSFLPEALAPFQGNPVPGFYELANQSIVFDCSHEPAPLLRHELDMGRRTGAAVQQFRVLRPSFCNLKKDGIAAFPRPAVMEKEYLISGRLAPGAVMFE
jgi:hypothetical protein